MEESKLAVFAAIAANLAIATMKFIAAALSGSSAMLSEGIHSLVDTGDGILLWVGMVRGKKPPDPLHPFGHGQELYFWTLIVAVLIFAVGGGMSAYEGITHLIHPRPSHHGNWIYLIFAGAFLFEGASWTFAWRTFKRERAGRSVWETISSSKNPTTFAILFEDTAALTGLVVATAGVWLAQRLRSPIPDAVASIVIGGVLMVTAALLVQATLRLLVGQSADPARVSRIRQEVAGDEAVSGVGRILTVHFGPENVVAQIELFFRRELGAEGVAEAIDRIQLRLKRVDPMLKHIFIEAESSATRRRGGPEEAASDDKRP
jgi:cation diffusion facilitator family transporter